MASRTAAPGATAVATTDVPALRRPDDFRGPAGALAVLTTLRRDSLLETVAMAAKELLRPSDLAVTLPKVAEQIGHATGVDRTHIFLIDAASGDGDILQHHTWTVPGIATPPEFRNAKAAMADVGLKAWIPRLERGETIVGHVCNFDSAARTLFDHGGVKSVLCVPVFTDGHWSGLIGFDDCRSERDWSAAEIDTIKTVAELVGAAVARGLHLKKLADANRIIESSPTILYRLSPQKPFNLIYLSQNVRRYGYDAD
jgi:GAF domain-containing protein